MISGYELPAVLHGYSALDTGGGPVVSSRNRSLGLINSEYTRQTEMSEKKRLGNNPEGFFLKGGKNCLK